MNAGRGIKVPRAAHKVVDGPFEHLQMDFIELDPCEGKKYALVIVDMFSKWVHIFPTVKADAQAVAKALICDKKVSAETRLNWVKCVPIVLFYMRTRE